MATTASTVSSIDTLWIIVGILLLFLIQAGFTIVETGSIRAKNAGNLILKNLFGLSVAGFVFWAVGHSFMFGNDQAGLIGGFSLFADGSMQTASGGVPQPLYLLLQMALASIPIVIVNGAMAERTKFSSVFFYTAVIALLVYPVAGHWVRAGGWLASLGFRDFGGSTTVHLLGGMAALTGAKLVGPRLGKYEQSGKPKAILGHNLPLSAVGVFVVSFAWMGFSTISLHGVEGNEEVIAKVLLNNSVAAIAATIAVVLMTWVRYQKPDISISLNGTLGGLVAISAGADQVSAGGAVLIGAAAALLVVLSIEWFDRRLRIDDPVGAVTVHGICGAAGTVLVGLLAPSGGVLYSGGLRLLGVQLLGTVAVAGWTILIMSITFAVLKRCRCLRVSPAQEARGLDTEEHGLIGAYPDFVPVLGQSDLLAGQTVTLKHSVPPTDKKSAAVTNQPLASAVLAETPKMTKVVIVTKQSMFERLRAAMDYIGVTGMTVSQVLGCGMQRGRPEYYRGVEMETNLLPKIEVEIVVCKIPVQTVIDAAKSALYTGHIGDGKIFVYSVENVIKVRTGEEGYNALQDVE